MKTCTKCGIEKELTDFGVHPLARDGKQTRCNDCLNIKTKEYRKTINGLVTKIYGNQRQNSKTREHLPPNYTRDELYDWIISQKNFKELYSNWVESDYEIKLLPSVDRKNDDKPYTLENLLRVCTWEENRKRAHSDVSSGINTKPLRAVVQFTKDGEFVARYRSLVEASKCTGTCNTSISGCAGNGRLKSAGGFIWIFEKDLLEDNL